MKNPWKTLSSKEIYQNPWIRLREDQVIQPDGVKGIYAVLEAKGKSVGVIPYDGQYIYIVGQHRYIYNEYSWEIPKGSAYLDEPIIKATKRELKEETGLVAKKLTKISILYPSNGISSQELHLFLAEGLTQKEAHPDPTERITVRKILLKDAITMVKKFEIKDVASVVAIQYLQIKLLNKKTYL